MKKNRKPTEEQKEAAAAKRALLCSMTAPFRPFVDANLEAVAAMMAGEDREKLTAFLNQRGVPAQFHFCTTLNACLQVVYCGQTGQTEWHSFQGWKEKGFSVNKGEKGFMIWSTPKKMTLKGEAENVETGETEQTEKTVHRFAIAYLFHAGQVSNEAGEKPESFNAAASPVEAAEIPASEPEAAPVQEETPLPLLALPAVTIWDVEEPAPGQVLVLCPPPAEPAHFQEEFDLLAA